jgi:pimeloyl-ACP methyl ester carboxylesterase
VNYAYVHGFASSSLSRKGVHLHGALSPYGANVLLPDLNVPSFETMTYTSMLSVLDLMDREYGGGGRWRLAGSSMGGYLVARWAELNPDRVDRVLLLCPGFDSSRRWPEIIGREPYRLWEESGYHSIADAYGSLRPLHWRFVEDARLHPAYPAVPCPTRIIHGTGDETVPVDLSRKYVREHPEVELVEVDDDHSLSASLEIITGEAVEFFGL